MLDKPHKICIAPMLEWTDRHFRFFLRLISKRVWLYSEMITVGAVLRGDRARLLKYHAIEHPIALQLGGSDPMALAQCAKIAEDLGYDEINLNVGCPSDRVQNGRFGACLMAEPELVGECIQSMIHAVSIPVTVKTRIGIDDRDSYQELSFFVEQVAAAGCKTLIVHARKAWLKGLSPKENREIPPLRYDVVHRLKQDFKELEIVLNGGIHDSESILNLLNKFDGIMVGRAAYHNPYMLCEMDKLLFNDNRPILSRHEVLEAYIPYIESELALGVKLPSISRHILGLFHGAPGGRKWRRFISENAYKPGAGIEVLRNAASFE